MAVGDRREIAFTDQIWSIANGGTGASTKEDALKNLGINATATELNYIKGVKSNVQTQLDNKASKSSISNITLTASEWSGTSAPYTYTLNINGVTTSNIIEILPQNSINANQISALIDAVIATGTQSANSIILKAFGIKPTIDIPITIIVRGDV